MVLKNTDPDLLSKTITCLRTHLLKKKFFEHHLYSTVPYFIRSTNTFNLKENLYLRFNPEPDIWQVGTRHEKFFWIGSMYRDEPVIDEAHQYEFTVIDIYLPHGEEKDVVDLFRELLIELEKMTGFQKLSGLPIQRVSHDVFHKETAIVDQPTWILVTEYPAHESFYDTALAGGRTKKFEIFYADTEKTLEIAACGELGDNINPDMFVAEMPAALPAAIREKQFIGFGIGLERLLSLYTA